MNNINELVIDRSGPLYQQIKDLILRKIGSGEWRAGDRIPTEHALVAELKASRMTINRALRELTQEGILARRQGSGTFVAPSKLESGLLEIRNIAAQIAGRGGVHSAELLRLEEIAVPTALKELMAGQGSRIFHCLMLHFENGVPVELEDRYVNPALVPGFIRQEFRAETPSGFLIRTMPYSHADHRISADIPTAEQKRLLRLKEGEPVLTLERHTWAGDEMITTVRLYHPGSRFAFGGAFTADR
ncbi:histidine utilization repressor [Sneathiella chungangensis]|uniref:Histidine utilization repressor n=1 Tax=Sneathiella chungangensis TaxID=1418234 RepID=A0A845MGE1_9PROT|nr:histidine utilization repressor [Sneathiella chungangensis]MZR22396.1 histidine utilization repressor [Sneathiella chungangensis]